MEEPLDPRLTPGAFFDLDGYAHVGLFDAGEPVWAALDRLRPWLRQRLGRQRPALPTGLVTRDIVIHQGAILTSGFRLEPGDATKGKFRVLRGEEVLEGAAVVMAGAHLFDEEVEIGEGTVIEPGALVKGPTLVGSRCEIRQGAYLRGGCLVGNGCIVGHTTEVKDAIFLDGAKAGHFAYVGDSILGRAVNLGAGTKLANLMIIEGQVSIRVGKTRRSTGRRKLGAVLGDRTEMGCNSVTSPGTLLGPGTLVYPCVGVPAGYYPPLTRIFPSRDSVRIRAADPGTGS